MCNEITKELLDFIEKSPSCYHVIDNFEKMLNMENFVELKENEMWTIEEGKSYFVTRNGSSIIAFKVPKKDFKSFKIVAAHSDSPTFKLKENSEVTVDNHYTVLNVEKYGGMICASWFDRPLSIAGRVAVKKGDSDVEVRLVNIDRDLVVIPNLAIHFNRNVNEGYAYNPQVDLLPIFSADTDKDRLKEIVAENVKAEAKDILGADLFLYNRQKGTVWGANNEFVSAPKLDDLQCAYTVMKGFIKGENSEAVTLCAIFDNEEVGSTTKQGADSTFLADVMERISECCGKSPQEHKMAIANGFMISADNAHAVHPNYNGKSDATNRPYINEGIVIKHNANQKYTTDAVSCGIVKVICQKANVPYQSFANRSDVVGGSTLGNISNTHISIDTVDIGLPQLAMHSPYESAGVKDSEYMVRLIERFVEYSLKKDF